MGLKTNNDHAMRQITKRARARMSLRPYMTLSDAINAAEMRGEHRVLTLEEGDYPRIRFADTSNGEREPE